MVADYVAEQLGIDDSSVLKAYGHRAQTAHEHAWEITDAYRYRQSPMPRLSWPPGWAPGAGDTQYPVR